jgi:hypothetical protein
MLGIPVPTIFMATNRDSSWEVVDGVQRLSTIIKFAGSDKDRELLGLGKPLRLMNLQKLSDFNSMTFAELPQSLQLHFETRPVKVVTLNDKSDKILRYDLFERLNTGGVALSNQEIRDCVFQGEFANLLEKLAKVPEFKTVVKLTPLQSRDGTGEECVLRFFAFRSRYKKFDHSVKEFLNQYMEDATKENDSGRDEAVFRHTFAELAKVFSHGLRRPGGKSTTPLNLYEGVAVGASLALEKVGALSTDKLNEWMSSPELRRFTTGATNDRKAVVGRIDFCRDRFLGRPYVPSTTT